MRVSNGNARVHNDTSEKRTGNDTFTSSHFTSLRLLLLLLRMQRSKCCGNLFSILSQHIIIYTHHFEQEPKWPTKNVTFHHGAGSALGMRARESNRLRASEWQPL